MKPKSPLGRSAGVVVPLFSLHTARSWGIGDIADLARCQAWLRRAGLQAVQVLPLGTLPPGETSPYSALSAMAIDPIYVAVDQAHDFRRSVEMRACRWTSRSRCAGRGARHTWPTARCAR